MSRLPIRTLHRHGKLGCGLAGFTLFEVVIVLGLLGVLSGLVLPAVSRWQAGLPMQRAETEVRDALLRARTTAITTGRPCGLQVSAGLGTYRTIWNTPAGLQTTEHHLPSGIRFNGGSAGGTSGGGTGGWSPPILFSADGIAADAVLKLADDAGHRSQLRLRRLTGSVSVEPNE